LNIYNYLFIRFLYDVSFFLVYNFLNVNKENSRYFGLLDIDLAFYTPFDLQALYLIITETLPDQHKPVF